MNTENENDPSLESSRSYSAALDQRLKTLSIAQEKQNELLQLLLTGQSENAKLITELEATCRSSVSEIEAVKKEQNQQRADTKVLIATIKRLSANLANWLNGPPDDGPDNP